LVKRSEPIASDNFRLIRLFIEGGDPRSIYRYRGRSMDLAHPCAFDTSLYRRTM